MDEKKIKKTLDTIKEIIKCFRNEDKSLEVAIYQIINVMSRSFFKYTIPYAQLKECKDINDFNKAIETLRRLSTAIGHKDFYDDTKQTMIDEDILLQFQSDNNDKPVLTLEILKNLFAKDDEYRSKMEEKIKEEEKRAKARRKNEP